MMQLLKHYSNGTRIDKKSNGTTHIQKLDMWQNWQNRAVEKGQAFLSCWDYSLSTLHVKLPQTRHSKSIPGQANV